MKAPAKAAGRPAITLQPPAAAMSRADRIGWYHALATQAAELSIMAALAAGIELHRAKAATEHGMFLGWVRANCAFGHTTANKYMALAEQLLGEELPHLLAAEGPPALEGLALATKPEAKSLTQLYHDLGICRPGRVGGRREGAGRPPANPDPTAELTEALLLANRFAADLRTWALADDGLGCLPDDALRKWLTEIGDVISRGRQILQGRKAAQKAKAK